MDGRIWFTNQHVEDHLDSDSVLEQEMQHYQPYEEVWLLFDVLMADFGTKRIKNQEVIDLLRPSSRIRIRSKVKKQVQEGVFIDPTDGKNYQAAIDGYAKHYDNANRLKFLIKDYPKVARIERYAFMHQQYQSKVM